MERGGSRERVSRVLTQVVTNATKLAGLVVGINEGVLKPHAQPVVILLAVVMIAGGQVTEDVLLGLADRFFGYRPPPESNGRGRNERRGE